MTYKKELLLSSVSVVITLFFSLLFMSLFLGGELRGNINWAFLPSSIFGVPHDLAEKGITTLYSSNNTGADGQFYYYMSNDIGALKDTSHHIDNPQYRYQRIGFPLIAKGVSLIFLQSWVSPLSYYLTYLILVLSVTFALANFFVKRGKNPLLACLWSLSFGVQLTLCTFLVDGAADALAILGILSYLSNRKLIYCIFMILAVLAKEAYVLIPFFLFIGSLLSTFYKERRLSLNQLKRFYIHFFPLLLPLVVFLAWKIYIKIHLYEFPENLSAQNLIGIPLKAFFIYYKNALLNIQTEPLNLVLHLKTYYSTELFWLSLFIITIVMTIVTLCYAIFKWDLSVEAKFIACGCLLMQFLYLSMGINPMQAYQGYARVFSFCYFLIPFFYVLANKEISKKLATFLTISCLAGLYFVLKNIIHIPPLTAYDFVNRDAQHTINIACLNNAQSTIEVLDYAQIYKHNFFRKLYHYPNIFIYTVKLINQSDNIFTSTSGEHSIDFSYTYLNKDSFKDMGRTTIRTPLQHDVLPGSSIIQNILVAVPESEKILNHSILRISVVQEGCYWFYTSHAGAYKDINLK